MSDSPTGGRYYYPSVDELLGATPKKFKALTDKLTRDWLICLVKDLVVHTKLAKSVAENYKTLENKLDKINDHVQKLTDNNFQKLEDKIDKMDEDLVKLNSSGFPQVQDENRVQSPPSSTWADVVKQTLDERDYDKQAEKTVVFYNIQDAHSNSNHTNDNNALTPILDKLSTGRTSIKSSKRLGKPNPSSNSRPRPIEVELNSVNDRNSLMAKVRLLKGTKVFVKPKLCWRDRTIEKALLTLRYNLVNHGYRKDFFRIRDLNLFYNGNKINLDDDINSIITQLGPTAAPDVRNSESSDSRSESSLE